MCMVSIHPSTLSNPLSPKLMPSFPALVRFRQTSSKLFFTSPQNDVRLLLNIRDESHRYSVKLTQIKCDQTTASECTKFILYVTIIITIGFDWFLSIFFLQPNKNPGPFFRIKIN